MMKKLSLTVLALAAVLAISPAAKASTYVNGTIDISTGNDFWSATGLSFTNLTGSSAALDATGNLSVIPNFTPVTIGYTPLTFGTPVTPPLSFTFTSGANTGVFTINSVWAVTANATYLSLAGTGTIDLTGYTQTYAIFTAGGSDSNNNYGGTGSSGIGFNVTANPAPEPSSLLLFGSGLLGLAGMVRRKVLSR
jgi:hypothetical protein